MVGAEKDCTVYRCMDRTSQHDMIWQEEPSAPTCSLHRHPNLTDTCTNSSNRTSDGGRSHLFFLAPITSPLNSRSFRPNLDQTNRALG